MQGETRFILSTMCKYDHRMFENTWSSSALTSGSFCGIYSGYSSQLILLKRSAHCGRINLDLVLASISPKARGWTKYFFVDVLITGSALGVYSNCLVVPGEESSPVSASFSLGSLGKRLVVGFLGDILPAARNLFRDCARKPDAYTTTTD
jgi:hypothetical protein